ncbi:MAG: pantothenate kinase, partial [Gammaproteobacteria bacterium]|nr:pantothenate kinase [Gammaproteobacteria bacterium]
ATDTADALAAGCLGAALGLVERSRREAMARSGTAPMVVLHGGGAGELMAWIEDAVHAPSLVMEGLARLARYPGRDG